jgi:hypothetical protein
VTTLTDTATGASIDNPGARRRRAQATASGPGIIADVKVTPPPGTSPEAAAAGVTNGFASGGAELLPLATSMQPQFGNNPPTTFSLIGSPVISSSSGGGSGGGVPAGQQSTSKPTINATYLGGAIAGAVLAGALLIAIAVAIIVVSNRRAAKAKAAKSRRASLETIERARAQQAAVPAAAGSHDDVAGTPVDATGVAVVVGPTAPAQVPAAGGSSSGSPPRVVHPADGKYLDL